MLLMMPCPSCHRLAKNGALIASWRKKLIRLLQRKVEDLPDDEEVAALAELDEYARDAELQGISASCTIRHALLSFGPRS